MSRKIIQLFAMMLLLLAVLVAVDKWMSSEGQIFQIVATAVTSVGVVFYSALRHEFGLPDDKPGTATTSTVTATSTTVSAIPKEDKTA